MRKKSIVAFAFALLILNWNSVYAVETKFAGSYYLQGWYDKNHSLLDKDEVGGEAGRGSSAFYTTRLRIGMNFIIAPGLWFNTRFDALSKKWQAARTPSDYTGAFGYIQTEKENIAWDEAVVKFVTPIGLFTVGNECITQLYGTELGDDTDAGAHPRIGWVIPFGERAKRGYLALKYVKDIDWGWIGKGTDNDAERYDIATQFNLSENTSVGYLLNVELANHMNTNQYIAYGVQPYKAKVYMHTLFFKHKMDKFYAEMETNMHHGVYVDWQAAGPGLQNINVSGAVTTYWHANYDLSPFLVGAKFIYSRGDDPETPNKLEGNTRQLFDQDGGVEPCLILWSKKYTDWFGPITGAITKEAPGGGEVGAKTVKYWLQNLWFYQVYGNYKIIPKLNIGASFTYAYADKKPTADGGPVTSTNPEFVGDKYGKELDLTLKYKIYDNLEYMIGAAYLWTGDYFKGTNPNAAIENNYLLTHKLTLTF